MNESGDLALGPVPNRTSVLLLDLHTHKDFSLSDVMTNTGFQVLASVSSLEQLSEALKKANPHLIFVSMPKIDMSDLSTIEALCPEQYPCAVFADGAVVGMANKLMALGVSAFVVGDSSPEKVFHGIGIALARFAYTTKLKQGLEQTQEKLEQRKVIDRAKGLLMDRRGMTESEAYHALRKVAMNSGQPMAVIARGVLDSQALMV